MSDDSTIIRKLPDNICRRSPPLPSSPFRRISTSVSGKNYPDSNNFEETCNNVIAMLSTLAVPEEPMVLCGNSDTNFLPEFVELIESVVVNPIGVTDSDLITHEDTTIDHHRI